MLMVTLGLAVLLPALVDGVAPFPDVRQYLPSPMPPLGRPSRALFSFEANWTNLNHGSYGAPPAAVQAVQREWMARMEANPERFIRWDQYDYIDHVRAILARYIGANTSDVVLIDNASHGMNAVLRSLSERLDDGALVLDLSLAYQMVKNTLTYCEAVFGHRVVTVNLTATPSTLPCAAAGSSHQCTAFDDDAIVESVRRELAAHAGAIKLLSVSHITSIPAIVLPVARLAALAHEHGALIAVDGAHALGQLALDVPGTTDASPTSAPHPLLNSQLPRTPAAHTCRPNRLPLPSFAHAPNCPPVV
jgi:selenocysteine lyase/cysteine desulfurase